MLRGREAGRGRFELGVLNGQIVDFVTGLAEDQGRPHVLTGFADASEIIVPSSPTVPYRNAIAIASALDPAAVATVKDGPTHAYHEETKASKAFVEGLERDIITFLNQQGHHAVRLVDARHELIERGMSHDDAKALSHRVIAAHAGLGWIGKNNLVITKHFGPAVTLGGVLTDAPVECGKEVFLSRCGRCVECIVACPVGAINNAEWSGKIGAPNLVDEDACTEACRTQSLANLGVEANVCGQCIWACPYAKSYLHRNGLRYT